MKSTIWIASVALIGFAAVAENLAAKTKDPSPAEYTVLRQQALASLDSLKALVEKAQANGVETSREKVTVVTAEQFLKFADWDHAHPEELKATCEVWWRIGDRAEPYSRELPLREVREIRSICDQAGAALQAVIDDPGSRRPVPAVDPANLQIKQGYFHHGDTPLFPSGFSWMPRDADLLAAYGDINVSVIAPAFKKTEEAVAKVLMKEKDKNGDSMGYVHFVHSALPDWAAEGNEGIGFATRCFTKYDIDHPGARVFWRQLLDDTIPQVAGTNRSRGGYMLANEPHWHTATDQWDTGPVSDYTKDKFRLWLSERHDNKIEALNHLWKTDFKLFDDVTIEIPMEKELRGQPVWFDWCRFNMGRVTEHFEFLASEVRRHDADAKVHMKIMPQHWYEDFRSHGMDMETLVRLQDIVGCDAKVGNATNTQEWDHFQKRYGIKWEEMVLSFDFYKSIAPEKLILDSEFHGLSMVHWRDENLSPGYVNCLLWLAHLHGMGLNQTWYWGREADGSPKAGSARDFFASNLTQPLVMNQFGRTMKELNAFAPEVISFAREPKHIRLFYSETEAINNPQPMERIKHTYKELYHGGHPVGFATGRMLREADSALPDGAEIESSLVIVDGATRVTEAELEGLRNYLAQGGRLLLVGENNFSQDEYGRPRTTSLETGESHIAKVATDDTSGLHSAVESFLGDVGLQSPIIINEQNAKGEPACVWRTIPTKDGHLLLVLNIGNSTAKLEITGEPMSCRDLFNAAPHSLSFQLEPFGVKLLRAESNAPQ